MITEIQNQNVKNSSPNLEMFGRQLHDLGDKIERIAERLKRRGIPEGDELYQLGDQVEHFYDQIATQTVAQLNSSSTVNTSQASE